MAINQSKTHTQKMQIINGFLTVKINIWTKMQKNPTKTERTQNACTIYTPSIHKRSLSSIIQVKQQNSSKSELVMTKMTETGGIEGNNLPQSFGIF